MQGLLVVSGQVLYLGVLLCSCRIHACSLASHGHRRFGSSRLARLEGQPVCSWPCVDYLLRLPRSASLCDSLCDRCPDAPPSTNLQCWSVMQRDFEREIIAMAQSEGMGLVPWNAGGWRTFPVQGSALGRSSHICFLS